MQDTGLSKLLMAGIVFQKWATGFPEVGEASAFSVSLKLSLW
jgi:hypothetical protein